MKVKNDQNGFTLIEVVIAIFMVLVGILGAIIMQNAAILGNNKSAHLTSATNWASDRQEILMALPYNDTGLNDANNSGVNAGVTGLDNTDTAVDRLADGGPVSQGNFVVFWNVADNYPIFGTKTIRVIVEYLHKGNQKTVSLDFTKMEPI